MVTFLLVVFLQQHHWLQPGTQAGIGIEHIPCFHVLGMPVGKREYYLFLSLIALLLLWEYELQLQNEEAVKMSRYVFEKVLKV